MKALIKITNIKRVLDSFVPARQITKYPIFIKSLVQRIINLRIKYNICTPIFIYNLENEKAKALIELENKGGVYIL